MYGIDPEATAEIIEHMRASKIGDYAKWGRLAKKIRDARELSPEEQDYFTRFARVYDRSGVTARSRIFHVRLSDEDPRPKCCQCGQASEFYCNQNDVYLCGAHVIGHDENEL